MRALDDAVRAGKVLYVGISDAPAWLVARANTLADWRDWSAFIGVQVPYSLSAGTSSVSCCPWQTNSVCRWLRGAPSAAVSSPASTQTGPCGARRAAARPPTLGSGTGDDRSCPGGRDRARHDLAQVALGWVLAQSPDIHPIVGARSADQLRENLEHLDRRLPPEILERLTEVSAIDADFLPTSSKRTHPGCSAPLATSRRATHSFPSDRPELTRRSAMPHLVFTPSRINWRGTRPHSSPQSQKRWSRVYGEWARPLVAVRLDGVPSGRWAVGGTVVDATGPEVTFGIRASALARADGTGIARRLVAGITDASSAYWAMSFARSPWLS